MASAGLPYDGPQQHLDDHAVRLLLHLKYYMLRYWHRLTDASGSLSDLYVSLNEALIALTGSPVSSPLPEEVRRAAAPEGLLLLRKEITSFEGHIERRLALTPQASVFPIEAARRVFRLEPVEVDVLLTLFRIQSNLEFCRLCTFAWADFTHKQPDVAFLIDLLSGPGGVTDPVAQALSPGGRLVRNRLVLLHDAGDWHPETPHFFQRVLLPNRMVRFLAGQDNEQECDLSLCELRRSARPLRGLWLDERAKQEAMEAWSAAPAGAGRPTLLALYGPAGVGKRSLAAALVADAGRRLLVIHGQPLFAVPPAEMEARLCETLRDALLLGAVPLLSLDGGWSPREDAQQWLRLAGLSRALKAHGGTVFVTAPQQQPWLGELGELHEVYVSYTTADDQLRAWRDALSGRSAGHPRPVAEYLASQCNLTAGVIYRAVEAAGTGRLDEDALVTAVRKQLRHQMGALASPVYTTLGWDDLILPEETLEQLDEIQHTMQYQTWVYKEWGFRKLAGGRRGLAVLFSGPPGTGKTVAACVLGRALNREVYRIDLSQVVDKYIGETGKNLSRLFDESEHAQVLLLFDEADSLFAKRTEVHTSHDRYANQEVNFLLQRIESYEGMAILTTNHEAAIDEAFKRRLRFRVNFPQPDEETRQLMWRTMVPKEAVLEDDVDWTELAEKFNFSGGHIRNAILRAAFLAAGQGKTIAHEHLLRAAALEARELGYLVHESVI